MPIEDERELICFNCGTPVVELQDHLWRNKFYYNCPACTADLDRLVDIENMFEECKKRLTVIDKLYNDLQSHLKCLIF